MTYCNRAIEVFNRLYVWFHHQAKTPTPLPAWRAVAVQSEWSCVISAYQEHAPVIYYHQNGTVLGHVDCVEWSSVSRQIIQSYCAYETGISITNAARGQAGHGTTPATRIHQQTMVLIDQTEQHQHRREHCVLDLAAISPQHSYLKRIATKDISYHSPSID